MTAGPLPDLPVKAFLPEIVQKLEEHGTLILSAAPGAGKTTLVPPALLESSADKILLLEPRRVAARAAATRIAALRGTAPGGEVGYAVRGESCASRATKLLAVTPGVLLRMLLDDPGLEGTGTVIFDEFHERSLENDLAFSLLLELRSALRPELKLLVMSATLESARLSSLLDNAPVLEIPGREYPVEIVYDSAPWERKQCAAAAARAVLQMLRAHEGDLLVFLPGAGEIAAAQEILAPSVPDTVLLLPLHGALPLSAQNAVLKPAPLDKRKVILATNVAESSLTIDGVTLVIDTGLERRMNYHPEAGISFLELCRISRASARQRAGRAGRTAPGLACRLWSQNQESAMPDFTPPEILSAELSGMLLTLSAWGTPPAELQWLDPPPEAALGEAQKLLQSLEFLDDALRITPRGKAAAALPVHPRIAALLLLAKEENLLPLGAELAALLEERDDHLHFHSADLRERVLEMRRRPSRYRSQCAIRDRLLAQQKLHYQEQDVERLGFLIGCAWPEWLGSQRTRHGGSYLLANGSGALLTPEDDLRGAGFLAVARFEGSSGREPAIRLAAPVEQEELELYFADRIREEVQSSFDPETGKVTARRIRHIDSLILKSTPCAPPPEEAGKAVLAEALRRRIELPPADEKAACRLLGRLRFAAMDSPEDFSGWDETKWLVRLPELLAPRLSDLRDLAGLAKLPWLEILQSALPYEEKKKLDQLYPDSFKAPSGSEFKLDYSGGVPTLPIRIQELYGLDKHPCIGRKKIPLKLELLSPARRPVQVTSDLPGFWRGSWKLVRTEMRGRYPKHNWPEDPLHP